MDGLKKIAKNAMNIFVIASIITMLQFSASPEDHAKAESIVVGVPGVQGSFAYGGGFVMSTPTITQTDVTPAPLAEEEGTVGEETDWGRIFMILGGSGLGLVLFVSAYKYLS